MGQKGKINNLIVWLSVFLLVIVSLELSLRIWSSFCGKVVFSKLTIDDQILDWRLSPNYVQAERGIHINSGGFRGKEFGYKKSIGSLRILALGDSCTFGAGSTTDEFVYPILLERKLRQSSAESLSFQIINAGVPGYTLRQCLLYYKSELWKLQSDIVVIYCGWNDIWTFHNSSSNTAASPGLRNISRVLGKSLLFSLCRDYVINPARMRLMPSGITVVFNDKGIKVDEASKARMLKAYKNNLDSLISEAKNSGSKVIVITLASPVRNDMDERSKKRFSLHPMWQEGHSGLLYLQQSVNEIIRGVAMQKEVVLVDIDKIISSFNDKQSAGLFSDAVHFNDTGNEVLADYLCSEIDRLVKIANLRG